MCASQRLDMEDDDATWSEKQLFFFLMEAEIAPSIFFLSTFHLTFIHTVSFPAQPQFYTLSKTACVVSLHQTIW